MLRYFLFASSIFFAFQAKADFACRFELELDNGATELSEAARTEISKKHFILVEGFLNELMPNYFKDNIRALKEMGATRITVLNPSSLKDIETNAQELAANLTAIHDKEKNVPLVVMGHSMGAVESFMMAAQAEIFDKAVEAMVLVQGPFTGSPVADFLTIPGYVFGLKNTLLGDMAHKFTQGLEALRSDLSQARMDKVIAIIPDKRRTSIEKRVRLIRSYTPRNVLKIAMSVGLPAIAMNLTHGKNDGLVLLKDQKVPTFELDMAVIKDVDHAGLVSDPSATHSIWPNHRDANYRGAFTRAVIMEALGI